MMFNDPDLFSISTVINAAKNRWKAAVTVFLLTILAAVLAAIFLPKTYLSEAMIFIRLGRETVSLDPTATTGSTISVLESRDNEINSVRDMLYSRSIVEKVVDRIGPEVVLGDEPMTDENRQVESYPEDDYLNSPRQKAIKQVVEDTYVVSARKSSVLIVSAKGSSPELAQRILREYLDVYQNMHNNAHQTPESNNFFDEQSKLLRNQWEQALKSLQIAKEDAGVVSIEGARENLKEQTHLTQTSLMKVSGSLYATRAKIKKFEYMIEKNPLHQQSVREDYLQSQGELSAMVAEKKALESQTRSLLERAAKLNRDEVTIGQMETAVELASDKFEQYQELHEQTRIEEALHNSRFTNIRVVQTPSFVPKAVSPKKSLIAAAGLVAATTGAVMVALLLELMAIWRQTGKSRKSGTEVVENNEFLGGPSIANG